MPDASSWADPPVAGPLADIERGLQSCRLRQELDDGALIRTTSPDWSKRSLD
jgi:hypothetical protein